MCSRAAYSRNDTIEICDVALLQCEVGSTALDAWDHRSGFMFRVKQSKKNVDAWHNDKHNIVRGELAMCR